ncbi:GD24815 [Drosophila simulans]|uniref:GD24815 n=2 Tax=Drosophila simulans TaxID=7240 RepID=B4NUF5_DROSI|nr:GD24815 [Drosophila simulans]
MHFQNPLATLGGTKAFLDHERTEAGVGFATETGTVSSRGSNDTFTTTSASSSFAAQQFSVPNALQRLLRPRQSASGDPMAQELLLESPRESKLHSLDGAGDGCGVGRQVPDILVADLDDDAAKSAGQFGGNYAGDDANARFVS